MAISKGVSMDCEGCGGACCKKPNPYIILDREAQRAVPAELQTMHNGRPVMKSDENGCAALKDGKCSIYESRPAYCRLWPVIVVEPFKLPKHLAAVLGEGCSVDFGVPCPGDAPYSRFITPKEREQIMRENSDLIELVEEAICDVQ